MQPQSASDFSTELLRDYRLGILSRECSLLGRKEVLTGKAKFGIFGDGKELAQLAWARVFRDGDFRSGYYRDQTFMLAIGALTPQQFFASLYADTDVEREPSSAGRQMNGHFATRTLNADGSWKRLVDHKNVSADISPTGGQMPRLLGLAQASKVYRAQGVDNGFSRKGAEVAWGTIGNASASEGLFWETINAAGVLQVPMVALVWDDEYGISVHAEHQTTKQNISKILAGFQRQAATKGQSEENGYEIIVARGWNYAELIAAFEQAEKVAREEHVPVLLHVREMTQPQGHSTSGSHERYKSKERLEWEQEYDCLRQFRLFLESNKIAKAKDLDALEEAARAEAREAMKAAFDDFLQPLKRTRDQAVAWLEELDAHDLAAPLKADKAPLRRDSVAAVRKAIQRRKADGLDALGAPLWVETQLKQAELDYASQLHSGTALQVPVVAPEFAPDAPQVDGRVVLRDNFKALFTRYPEAMIFGEDVGHIGDVNQGLEGMQAEFGKIRVSDTGIREATIAGQGIGLAMRGLRPIAEIQYLDYLLYAVQILSDDCATVRWRSAGGQKAPLIVRTRGHRLEGVWHSGSPMQLLLGSLRGMYLCTPRNMVQAAGMYTTLMQADEPAVVIECLNGYRLKEPLPTNLGTYTVPLGRPEILRAGTDVTVVSYGSTLRIILDAAAELERLGVSIEVVDVQTLLPFDLNADCVASLQRTNRLLVVDEDVPGGAAAYLMQQILEVQGGYRHLDAAPRTLTAKAHRPAYGSDGDYFSKPSAEDVVDTVLELVGE
jgi:pyruvate/2-oxoglutarate/acetoin dehydrogenase E1 component/TPP-dependent pyruvate/acetoin dehydrogenase alpha subunit